MLAGLSVDYYTRVEKGSIRGVSDAVLHAISDALQLDEAERAYLLDLARAANASARAPRRPTAKRVSDTVQRIIDAMPASPAFVRNNRLDILATNALARALYAPVLDSPINVPGQHPNLDRFQFLDPAADDFFPETDLLANVVVDLLRAEAGRDPYDQALSNLVGELSTRSADFRTRWAAQNVRLHRAGSKIPTPSSATWSSTSKPWTCLPTTASSSPPIRRDRAHRPPTDSACSPAGQRPSRPQPPSQSDPSRRPRADPTSSPDSGRRGWPCAPSACQQDLDLISNLAEELVNGARDVDRGSRGETHDRGDDVCERGGVASCDALVSVHHDGDRFLGLHG